MSLREFAWSLTAVFAMALATVLVRNYFESPKPPRPDPTPAPPAPAGRRTVLLYSMAGCRPCAAFRRWTLRDHKVSLILAAGYNVVQVEDAAEARKAKVTAYPTVVVRDPDGRELGRHAGYLGPEQFLAFLASVK